MAFSIINNSTTESVLWGKKVIPPTMTLQLSNVDIASETVTLNFEQFSVNTQYAADNVITIMDNVSVVSDQVEWIEEYYNNPSIAYDSATGQGDMVKSVYDSNYNDIVDNAERITYKTNNTVAPIYTLISANTIVHENVIGVHIGDGKAIMKGNTFLAVKNDTGNDIVTEYGVTVYYEGGNGIGVIKSNTPGVKLDNGIQIAGMVADGGLSIPDGGVVQIPIFVDIKDPQIQNPNSDGSWLRKKEGPADSWTEEVDGGTF